jgi:hypothetical protein
MIMNIAMISVAPDVLCRLLALRVSETESLEDVLRRALRPIGKPAEPAAARAATQTRNTNGTGLAYHIDGECIWHPTLPTP